MLLPRVLTVALLVFTFALTSAGGQPQTRFKGPPSSDDIPADRLPVGRWSVEFANGVVEACEIRKDATAFVVEPKRISGGKVTIKDGGVVMAFDDDRAERWTPVGRRMVVEHWFPGNQFPSGKPVFGIAERAVWPSEVEALRKKIEQLQQKIKELEANRTPVEAFLGRRSGEADDSQQVAKVYRLKHAVAEHVVVLLHSLFIVVNQQEAYARFHFDKTTNSLIVGASGHHQRQIARVLALVDTPDNAPVQAVESDGPEQLVKGYRIKHADGEAAVAVLRSLFLVVNHRIAYARFGYDARRRFLIAIASEKHQKQIARVLDLLDTQTIPATAAAGDGNAEQPVRVYPIKHIDGEELIAKLRAQFVVVNHQQAEARFGFDQRTHLLIVIATGKLHTRIRDLIARFDQSQVDPGKAQTKRTLQ